MATCKGWIKKGSLEEMWNGVYIYIQVYYNEKLVKAASLNTLFNVLHFWCRMWKALGKLSLSLTQNPHRVVRSKLSEGRQEETTSCPKSPRRLVKLVEAKFLVLQANELQERTGFTTQDPPEGLLLICCP